MKVLPGNASHIGNRTQQQDAFALSDFADTQFIQHGGYLAVLADGIAGLEHGARAANIAVTQFVSHYLRKPAEQSVEDALDIALDTANVSVCSASWLLNCAGHMGTTLVAALIHQSQLYWRAVGDSHLYLCRNGRLSQLNVDHNFARELQMLVNEGIMTQHAADTHPERKTLQCFLGMDPVPEIDRNRRPLPLRDGDIVLLCSDGIDSVLSADEIIACLGQTPMMAAQSMCDQVLAKRLPYQDNLTAVVLAYRA